MLSVDLVVEFYVLSVKFVNKRQILKWSTSDNNNVFIKSRYDSAVVAVAVANYRSAARFVDLSCLVIGKPPNFGPRCDQK